MNPFKWLYALVASQWKSGLSFVRELVSATEGSGPSSTKFAYLVAVVLGVSSASVVTLIGGWVYLKTEDHHADWTFWVTVAGLWTTIFGFVSGTKMHQTKTAGEIAKSKGEEDAGGP